MRKTTALPAFALTPLMKPTTPALLVCRFSLGNLCLLLNGLVPDKLCVNEVSPLVDRGILLTHELVRHGQLIRVLEYQSIQPRT